MATITQRGLGKGLSALIPDSYDEDERPAAKKKAAPPVAKKATAKKADSPAIEEGLMELAVTQLQPGKYQPRTNFSEESLDELSVSIKKNGIMQPIVVRPHARDLGKYEIIAGERRWRAAQKAGLAEVPVLVRAIEDKQALELALVENIQRQDLSPLEEAYGYQQLIEEFEYTQEELSGVIGKSRSHIANLLRLLSLPETIRTMVDKNELTMGHARALIGVPGSEELAKDIVKRGLNVRQVEKLVRDRQGGGNKRTTSKRTDTAPVLQSQMELGPKDPDIIALEESLSENLGMKVSINDRGQSGEIVLAYDSLSQLDGILRRLGDGF